MRIIKYNTNKITRRYGLKLKPLCPYRVIFRVGTVDCMTCKYFKAMNSREKIVLCQGDEMFESYKSYKFLLCEKKSNYNVST